MLAKAVNGWCGPERRRAATIVMICDHVEIWHLEWQKQNCRFWKEAKCKKHIQTQRRVDRQFGEIDFTEDENNLLYSTSKYLLRLTFFFGGKEDGDIGPL